MVAVDLPVMFPLLAANVAELTAAANMTDAGTLSKEFVLARAITAPPAGAGWDRLTVQLLDVFGPMLVGLQVREETSTDGVRRMLVFAELPLYVALLMAAVVTVNVAEVAEVPMVTDPGIVSVVPVLDRTMLAPPVGAACVRVTVQVLEEFEARLLRLQDREDSDAGATRVNVVLAELALSVAVIVALALLPKAALEMLNVAAVPAAGIETDAGTVSAALLLASVMVAPLLGAA
jgi:hypothetical protein